MLQESAFWLSKSERLPRKQRQISFAVFTAEGKLLEMRKNIGQPFLGPDKLPLVIQGIVMCGDRPEWKDKVGAWSMDDYHLAPNGEKWASRIRNPGELEGMLIGNDTRFEIMG